MGSAKPLQPPQQATDEPKQAGPATPQAPLSQGDPRKVFNDFASI
ncbi:hypothetical protein [Roseovarius sp. MMSF_3281]|nr:hypothetical protein [Roseovarius sp. MMSF_3281]